ncbi:hypothetical protein Aco04nite_62880 [Winogradskya consettensis]|uniref:Uncharacterized protein n=2 Tax=Winogradskya consettensis TaxID=113560 RepID=A0A919SXG3_9ACTN|nr:hypothetical protein Aco04nite_62880 [Actinoplanes consettensis]
MEEVAMMRLNYTIERPSTLPAAFCTPSASWLPMTALALESALVVESAPVAILAAERAPVSQAHQVQVQAELAQVLVSVDGSYETSGFTGGNGTDIPMKRRNGASGVPPRGRPV